MREPVPEPRDVKMFESLTAAQRYKHSTDHARAYNSLPLFMIEPRGLGFVVVNPNVLARPLPPKLDADGRCMCVNCRGAG